jgi:glycosyltransferase involved in cell wall biosynthesis
MSTVSVIIPARNAEATLAAALDSVAAQSGVEVETIVVDDGSTDETPAVAAGHSIKPEFLRSTGSGASAARNLGLAAATGRYVVFLDGDDLLKPGALQGRLAALRGCDPETIVVSDHVELVDGRERPSRTRPDLGEDPRDSLLRSNRMAIHAVTVPRELLARVPGPFQVDLATYEDWALWLRLALLGARFRVLDLADCVYRVRPKGMTTDRRRARRDAIRVVQLARQWVDQTPAGERARLEAVRRRTLRYLLTLEARDALRRGNLLAGAAYAGRAASVSPLVSTVQAWQKAVGWTRRRAGRTSRRRP